MSVPLNLAQAFNVRVTTSMSVRMISQGSLTEPAFFVLGVVWNQTEGHGGKTGDGAIE